MPTDQTLFDITNPRYWSEFVRELPLPNTYIGDTFLPRRDVFGDRWFYDILTSESELAPFVSIGAETPRMDMELMKQGYAEIAAVRYKRVLDEAQLRILRTFGMEPPGNDVAGQMARASRQYLEDQVERLNTAVDNRIEWLQIKSLQGSVVVATEARSAIQFTITYPVVTQTAGTLWSTAATATPLLDMANWFAAMPVPMTRMITSRRVLLNLQRSAEMRNSAFTQIPTAPSVITPGAVNRVLSAELGLEVTTYETRYTTRTDTGTAISLAATRMLPDTLAIFLPSDPVGYTAEAPALLNDYRTGKFTWFEDPTVPGGRKDPPVYETGVGWYGIPVVNQPQNIIVATVIA